MARFFEDGKCPICSAYYKAMNLFRDIGGVFECGYCGKFGVSNRILSMSDDHSELLFKCINLMHSFLISHRVPATYKKA